MKNKVTEKDFLRILKKAIKEAYIIGDPRLQGKSEHDIMCYMNQSLLYLNHLVVEIEEYENKI